MTKNLYYQHFYGRRNVIKEFIFIVFISISSWPRLLLEVFIRKNFGERYFSFSTAIIIIALVGFWPLLIDHLNVYNQQSHFMAYFEENWLIHVYLLAFLYMCLLRREEIKRLPSVYDFARFSFSTGNINPFFFSISINGKTPDVRLIETVLEPGIFLVIGILLHLIGQSLGYLLIACSIIYSLSYFAAYHMGDNFVMNKIDEMICNEELVASFVEGLDSSQTRGFNTVGRKPANKGNRRKVVDNMTEDIDFEEVR